MYSIINIQLTSLSKLIYYKILMWYFIVKEVFKFEEKIFVDGF